MGGVFILGADFCLRRGTGVRRIGFLIWCSNPEPRQQYGTINFYPLRQLASGLNVLHRHNFIHRDLKPQNILLIAERPPVLRIADFGFSRALLPQDMAATICGSPLYMAPEILRHEKYDSRADLWSVGAILFECFCGRPPYNGPNPMQLLANIERSLPEWPDDCELSVEGRDFLLLLLQRSPEKRPAANTFMDHEYVSKDLELESSLTLFSSRTTDDGVLLSRRSEGGRMFGSSPELVVRTSTRPHTMMMIRGGRVLVPYLGRSVSSQWDQHHVHLRVVGTKVVAKIIHQSSLRFWIALAALWFCR